MKKLVTLALVLTGIIGAILILIVPTKAEMETDKDQINRFKSSDLYQADTPTPKPSQKPTAIPVPTASPSPTPTIKPTISPEEKEALKIKKEKEKKRAKKRKIEKMKKTARYKIYDYREKRWYTMNVKYQDYLRKLCIKKGILKYFPLILVQLYCESGYNPKLTSGTNDYGLAQINKCNHSELRKKLGITDFLNPYQSLKCNVYYMASYLKKYTTSQALSKYNTGRAYNSTIYSRKILRIYNHGKGVKMIK